MLDMKKSFDTEQVNGAGASVQNHPGSAVSPQPDDMQLARERLMLYLELLRVPPQQADELLAKAIRQAQLATGGNPIQDAMRALQELLGEEKVRIASMPPLNRGAMVPVEIDRQPWWTFLKKRILRMK
jgi:hypothetical protein